MKTALPIKPRNISFRSVALPAEHGSWSLVLEPIVLGLAVAFSWAGLLAAIGAFAFFLLNRPLKIVWTDYRRNRSYERTVKARQWAIVYGAVGIASFALCWLLAGARPFLPVLIAGPLLVLFVIYDQRPARHWVAEVTAPVAFAAIVATIALAASWTMPAALALWGFVIARSVPAVLYIRSRLRLDREIPAGIGLTIGAHLLALGGVWLMVRPGWLPWTAIMATLLLLLRAAWGLSPIRRRTSVKRLGLSEMAIGFLVVLLVVAGYRIL